jgi:hypothetical protein
VLGRENKLQGFTRGDGLKKRNREAGDKANVTVNFRSNRESFRNLK